MSHPPRGGRRPLHPGIVPYVEGPCPHLWSCHGPCQGQTVLPLSCLTTLCSLGAHRETCIRKSLISFRISFGSNFGYWVPPLNVKFKNVTSCRRESNSIRVGPCSHQTVGSDASSLTFFRRKACIHTTRKACMRVQSAMSDVDVISLISASLSDQENLENLPHPQLFMRCC